MISTFRRGALGQAITVIWPGGAVALLLLAFSAAPSLSLAGRSVAWALAGAAVVYGLVMMRRIRLRVDERGLLVSNGLRTFRFDWHDISEIDIEEVRVLAAGGLYGLVVHPAMSERHVVVRASFMLSNKDKQRVLDLLHRELSSRGIRSSLPREAKTFWVGPRAREPLG